jgi:rod shape-determining protein MreD
MRGSILAPVIGGLLAVFLQGTLLKQLFPMGAGPDIVLTLVVFTAFFQATLRGAFLAFILGLLVDLSSATIVGPRAGAYVFIFGFLSSLSQRLFIESSFAVAGSAFAASLVAQFVYVVIFLEFHPAQTMSLWPYFSWSTLSEAVTTALLAPGVFWLMKGRWRKRRRKVGGE